LISSNWEDIVNGTLDERRRRRNLIVILFFAFYAIPIASFHCIRQYFSQENKSRFKLIIPDALGQFGLAGEVLNYAIVVFTYFVCAEKILLRRLEEKRSLEFMTNMRYLFHGEYFDLNADEVERLTCKIKKKIIFFRTYQFVSVITSNSVIASGTILFIYRNQQLLPVMQALILHVGFSILVSSVVTHLSFMFLSYMLVTDCLKARIQSLDIRLSNIPNDNFRKVSRILNALDSILVSLQIYNRNLRPLLRSLIYLSKCGLCALLVVSGIAMPPLMRLTSVVPITSTCILIVAAALYVCQVGSRLRMLYGKLNSVYNQMSAKPYGLLDVKWKTRLALKELGNDGHDAHFVMGLAAGYGPEITSMEVINDVIETICNAMMFMGIVHKKVTNS
jgi:hypothetical protein